MKIALTQSFARRLASARENFRWTQADLAKASGLSNTAVSHFEAGRRLPSFKNLIRIAQALRVSADWLLGLSEEQKQLNVSIDGVRYFPSVERPQLICASCADKCEDKVLHADLEETGRCIICGESVRTNRIFFGTLPEIGE